MPPSSILLISFISSSVSGTGFEPGPTNPVTPLVLRTFKGIKAEFKKIIWPDKDKLVKETIAVIFLHFHSVWVCFLILCLVVITLLAFCACQCNLYYIITFSIIYVDRSIKKIKCFWKN